jgi:hypothetical protein
LMFCRSSSYPFGAFYNPRMGSMQSNVRKRVGQIRPGSG